MKSIDELILHYKDLCGLPCYYVPFNELYDDLDIGDSCEYCRLICGNKDGCTFCNRERQSIIRKAIASHTCQILFCHAGLIEWIVPLIRSGNVSGVLISGFVESPEHTDRQFKRSIDDYMLKCAQNFGIAPDSLLAASASIPRIKIDQIVKYSNMLLAMCESYISINGMPEYPRIDASFSDVYLYPRPNDDSRLRVPRPSMPMSIYISKTNPDRPHGDLDFIKIFWKSVEHKSSAIVPSILAGRRSRAKQFFDEIMDMALNESTIQEAKISAESLFYIVFLKFYNKDFYDTRFYVLAYQAINAMHDANSIHQIKAICDSIFNRMFNFYNAPSICQEDVSPVVIMMEYIDNNFNKPITVDDITEAAHLSKAYASRLFKSETTITIKSYLTNLRMVRAYELLTKTNMPIVKIATTVGYENIRSFYKAFSSHYSMSCSYIRKRHSIIISNIPVSEISHEM